MLRLLLRSTLFPYTTLFRSEWIESAVERVEDTRGRLRAVTALLEDRAKLGIYDEQQEIESQLRSAERERSEEHTSELQSRGQLVCRLLLEKKKILNDTARHR